MTKLKNVLFAFALLCTANVFSQSESRLELREDGSFQIPSVDLKEVYKLDLTELNLESFEDALNLLSHKNTDLILFRPNNDGTEATVFLQLSKKPQWTVSDWNSAISEITFP